MNHLKKINFKSINYFMAIKWIVGIYLMGILANLSTYVLSFVPNLVYAKIMQSNFMTIELVYFADLIRQQLIPLLIAIPFMIPGLIIFFSVNSILNKTKWFPGWHKKVYMTILSSLIVMMTLSIFLLS